MVINPVRLKYFRINKTLKPTGYTGVLGCCLKYFRINKTLKPDDQRSALSYSLKYFRINKTLKQLLRFPMKVMKFEILPN